MKSGPLTAPPTMALVTVLIKALESRDPYTAGHGWRVSRYAVDVAHRLGWSQDASQSVELGAMLHDLGKIGVPDGILGKHGPLTATEWKIMQRHPDQGAALLRMAPDLMPLLPAVWTHHERWDGTGYPHGLAGRAIPASGRLVAVVDAFDAMTSARPYRRPLAIEEALARLDRGAGIQWDAELVSAFRSAWEAGDFDGVFAFSHDELPLLPCTECGPLISVPPQAAIDRRAVQVLCPGCGGAYRIAQRAGHWVIAAQGTDQEVEE